MFKVAILKFKTLIKYIIIFIFFIFSFLFLISSILKIKFNPNILNLAIPYTTMLSNVKDKDKNIDITINKKTKNKNTKNNKFLYILNNTTNLLNYEIPLLASLNNLSNNQSNINVNNTNNLNTTKIENKKKSNNEKQELASISTENKINENIDKFNKSTFVKIPADNLNIELIPNNIPNTFNKIYRGVKIKNTSNKKLNDDILNYDNLKIDKSNILIFHTHTCESYTPTKQFTYKASGNFRTIDLNYSVSKVGDVLSNNLNLYNYKVLHDKTFHDYPAYSGSYGRSLETIKNLQNKNKNTNYDIIIDIHRDAIADSTYAPSIKIDNEICSQLMFVIGTDGGGLEHPNWQQNLKFAIKVQNKANELYPGLFRSILVRNSRYNQHLSKAACLIEVGSTGNTLEQSMASMKYLAKVLNEI